MQIANKCSYQVKLELFEGPLDLLLHLVTKEKLDICEISLAQISDQYIEYLKLMEQLNIEIESSFLVVFASLIEIKSRLLLPPAPSEEPQLTFEEESSSAIDLVEKLKEYKKYKDAALKLQVMEKDAVRAYPRWYNEEFEDDSHHFLDVSLFDLMDAIQNLMLRKSLEEEKLELRRTVITIPQCMKEIWEVLLLSPRTSFLKLFTYIPTREEVIVTFLALLELTRLRKIRIVQEVKGGEIFIIKRMTKEVKEAAGVV